MACKQELGGGCVAPAALPSRASFSHDSYCRAFCIGLLVHCKWCTLLCKAYLGHCCIAPVESVPCWRACAQVRQLFPSARDLKCTWHSIVKIGQSLYREAPGMDPYRPDQTTPVPNFFLAGSYTKQVRAGWACCCTVVIFAARFVIRTLMTWHAQISSA
jgi:hypothetical protein